MDTGKLHVNLIHPEETNNNSILAINVIGSRSEGSEDHVAHDDAGDKAGDSTIDLGTGSSVHIGNDDLTLTSAEGAR